MTEEHPGCAYLEGAMGPRIEQLDAKFLKG